MQKVVAEFDEWEMDGGEEKMMVNVGEPLPRVVSGGAPCLQKATEATSDLKHALEKVYLSRSANEDGGSCVSSSSSSPYSKACVVSETVVAKYRFLDVDICRGDISELSPILFCNIVRFLKK
ncbi:hypothetical protein FXO38_27334 [Capsicum annuum]|nr:hypothetical protein FXO38_27334 [Capsicum annuum]KAF3668601.1 hypothetical protein FXO37_09462 [Capsicum annuum]